MEQEKITVAAVFFMAFIFAALVFIVVVVFSGIGKANNKKFQQQYPAPGEPRIRKRVSS